MRKRLMMLALCLALLGLSACGKAATTETTTPDEPSVPPIADTQTEPLTAAQTESQTETQTDQPTEPETFVAATVSVRFVPKDLVTGDRYETFSATDDPQTRIELSTNATVRDFKVLALTNGDMDDDGEMHFDVQELYTLDRLTADHPLVVSTTFYGLIPNNGISYVDETGATRFFAVDMSGEDGSLYLWEFH